MEIIRTNNQALLEVLADNGVEIICNDKMQMVITEGADKIAEIVNKYAPEAAGDYTIENDDLIHTIEDVELTKHGYHHDCLTYVADGKYCQFDGEFYVDKEGYLHHTHIFDDGIEKEIVVKY